MRPTIRLSTATLLLLTLAACDYQGGPTYPDPGAGPIAVQSVDITPARLVLRGIGVSRKLSAMITPMNATDQALRWFSYDTAVATVDSAGLLTTRAAGGDVLITARTLDDRHAGGMFVTVLPDLPDTVRVPVTGVRVTPQSIQLAGIGSTRLLTVVVTPTNADDQALTWESTDTTIVTVNNAGLVTARAVGQGVHVTAFTHDGHFESSVVVTVLP